MLTGLCWALPTVANAGETLAPMPNYNFVEFNIAFVLGVSLPLLLLIALLKPLVALSWRYPAILTLSVLTQFYSLIHLSTLQFPVLLLASAVFVFVSFYWLSEQKQQDEFIAKVRWGANLVFVAFLIAVVFVREVDVFTLWLGYAFVLFFMAMTVLWRAKDLRLKSVIICWSSVVAYSVGVHSWLNVTLDTQWLVSLTILTYSLVMINGLWNLVQQIGAHFEQIKEVVQQKAEVPEQSTTLLDPTTNLPTFQQALNQLKRAMVSESDHAMVAIVFKPVNFSQVNKVLGHQNSDILLLQLAYNLEQSVASNERLLNFSDGEESIKIARLQGLDFLMIFNGKELKHPIKIVVEDLCQKLCQAVPQAMSFKSFSLNFQLAFGVAITDGETLGAEQLIAQASDALLEVERSGQTVGYFDRQSTLYTEQQLARMEKLRKDIQQGNLNWQISPQIAVSDRTIRGFELEIDWRTNDGNRLSKLEFAQISEYSGEIYQLTKQVIHQAFALLKVMHQLDIKQTVSINLSSSDLLQPELADFIEKESNSTGIALTYLIIELDEKVLLNSAFRARMMVDQLKALGVKIAIDDFSGSYEALRYLRRTSIHQVKIDCGQLNNDDGVKSEKTIVNALINLIRKMAIPLVATNINNREIEKSYTLMGGDVAQGKAIKPALTLEETKDWLTAWQANQQA